MADRRAGRLRASGTVRQITKQEGKPLRKKTDRERCGRQAGERAGTKLGELGNGQAGGQVGRQVGRKLGRKANRCIMDGTSHQLVG